MGDNWKELKIDNLPSDILTGDYEFAFNGNITKHKFNNKENAKMLIADLFSDCSVRYRTPEPKPPTHEEIMTKWWLEDYGMWRQVECYLPSEGYHIRSYKAKKWFTNRESAVIPPEGGEQ